MKVSLSLVKVCQYAALAGLLVLGMPVAQAQTPALCCVDSNGSRTCGDVLPPACYERAYVEIRGGRVVREVDAPLTPEQRAKKDLELRVQREKLAREAESRRRDQVLLESYSTIGELDRRRDRDLGNVEGELRAAQATESALLAKMDALGKRKPATGKIPKPLVEAMAANASELEAIRSVIASKQRQITQMKDRFDADHTRYLQLTDPGSQIGVVPRI